MRCLRRGWCVLLVACAVACCGCTREPDNRSTPSPGPLPPAHSGASPLEELLRRRHSDRNMDPSAWLTKSEVSSLMWAAQGARPDRRGRTAPSAGGLYPLELYLVAFRVKDLDPGVYRFDPQSGEARVVRNDVRADAFFDAAMQQDPVKRAAAVFVISGVWARTTKKYGDRGRGYVWMEAGHASQNLLLRAAELQLKSTPVGAFVQGTMDAWQGVDGESETALYLNCVGR